MGVAQGDTRSVDYSSDFDDALRPEHMQRYTYNPSETKLTHLSCPKP